MYRVRLKSLHSLTATAVEEIAAAQDGTLGKGLKEFLSEVVAKNGKNKEAKTWRVSLFASSHRPLTRPLMPLFFSAPNQ
ncbi:hypothetical protein BJV74DRAFT_415277 [Russula compacta]|nr:hypothetical protein BJV74DRAFT_415277 [Russula compacta]